MTEKRVYVDPSALARLYIHGPGSREMAAWRAKFNSPLEVTHHGQTEITNAICRAAFLGALDSTAMGEALLDLDADFANGHLRHADILWRAALSRSAELSREHTPRLGTRALDVLHVACAIELKIRLFLTFDERQGRLAEGVGLKLIQP